MRAWIAVIVVVVLVVCGSSVASVASVAFADGAREPMETYFAGEKRGGLVLVGMGAAGLGGGALLATRDSRVARGAGYALLGFGVVHAAAGVFVYVSSAGRVTKFGREISADEAGFVAREKPRIVGVQGQFTALKITEVVLIGGGGAVAAFGLATDRDLLAGIAIGVAVEAGATLLFDIVAARRAGRYLKALAAVRVDLSADPSGADRTVFSVGARF